MSNLRSFGSSLQLGAALLLAAAPSAASAQQVLFDNGAPDNQNGYQIIGGLQTANDFTLTEASSLGSFTWFGLRDGADNPNTISTSFDWAILTNAAGAPGTLLYSGTETNLIGTKTSYYCCGGGYASRRYETFQFDVPLANVGAVAGTYWLRIGNATNGINYWATSNARTGNQFSSGQPSGAEGAFSVSGSGAMSTVPEPGTYALMGTGLLALGGVAARRKRASA